MKQSSKRICIFVALFLLTNSLAGLAINAEELPESAATAVTPDTPSPDKTLLPAEAPEFHASIEYSYQGYVVKGSFTEIPADISLIQPLYSLDGETYQICGEPWDLHWLENTDDNGVLDKLYNQTCLYSNQEPLKSYLEQKLDRFYLKLRLVLKNGTAYETQEALIDRGSPQPVPEELHLDAFFAPSLAAYEMRPFCGYGKYQITVSANTSPEEITSCLPDTLPIEIQLAEGLQHITSGIVDCPITWKPLSLPQLAAGESVTIRDAAEEIVVPESTLLNTPTGIFQMNAPLKLSDQHGLTDEVRLVLNVVSEDAEPTGALTAENTGLEMAFHLKPTGATEIQAYVWSENSPAWTRLSNVSLLDAVNDQPSTASSGYALVIGCDQEPYRSYLAETAAGNSPTPFLIGLTIKGGVYDGQQLILPWPDTYEIPLALPKLDGSGGNELNAGSDNKNDSTPEGQRPNLPSYSKDNNDAIKPPAKRPQTSESTLPVSSNTDTPSNTVVKEKTISPTRTGSSETVISPYTPGLPETIISPYLPGLSEIIISPYLLSLSPKISLAHSDKSGNENQRHAQELTSRNSESDIQLSDTSAAEKPATPSLSSKQNENTDEKDTSSIQEMPNRSIADTSYRIFLPLAAVAFIILVIGIAAAARRIAANRKSGKI